MFVVFAKCVCHFYDFYYIDQKFFDQKYTLMRLTN